MKRRSVSKALAAFAAVGLVAVAILSPVSAGAKSRGLKASMKDATGASLGTVTFKKADDGKIVVLARVQGLTPGFHGYHVHTAGVCDPAATDSTGATVPFFSAGGHFNPVTENTHGNHAGDMPPLLVAQDGTAVLRFKTDRFLLRDLTDSDGSAVVMHAAADNLAHIPATTTTGGERYHSHVDNIFGPDTATKATGDAGARFGCGVVTKA
jgi:superoxide dismutase, Cu-Zn family